MPTRHEKGDASVLSSRDRILKAAKTLFAGRGYEQATTSAIARLAGTSETQVLKHFGSKQGLLDAIFTTGWKEILGDAEQTVANLQAPLEKLPAVVKIVLRGFEADPELKLLILLEGRRIRKSGPALALSEGFLAFVRLTDEILNEMRDKGILRPDVHPQAVRSALMGMLEGLLRDSLLAQKAGYPANYSVRDLPWMFEVVLNCFASVCPTQQANEVAKTGQN